MFPVRQEMQFHIIKITVGLKRAQLHTYALSSRGRRLFTPTLPLSKILNKLRATIGTDPEVLSS